jgi:hypothetical protein
MRRRRQSWLGATVLVGGCATVLLGWAPPSARSQWISFFPPPALFQPPTTFPDPVPLRRLAIPPELLPEELKRGGAGVVVKLPRKDFEDRVQRAAQAMESRRHPPRLLKTHYRARLFPEGALTGSGLWTIAHSSSGPGVLHVPNLNLALTRAQLDGSAAILAELEGNGPGLLIEGQGDHEAVFDWTARGEPGPDGLHFRLDIPPCPLASLEVELPGDHLLELATESCLLRSPRPVQDGRRLWRVECPGRSQLDFVVRRTPDANRVRPLVLARLREQQTINLDQLEADFDFSLEIARGGVRDLSFECDPALRPLSVSIRNVESESWEWHPGIGDKTAYLQLHLPGPVQGTVSVRVHCLAVTNLAFWHCPGVRLSGAILLDESLSLTMAPEIRVDDWQPGDFELVHLEEGPGGSQSLTLAAAGRHDPEVSKSPVVEGARGEAARAMVRLRPRARLRIQGAEAEVRELLWWQVTPQNQTLTVALAYQGIRGALFRMPVRLPSGWKVERVETTPAAALQQWLVVPAGPGASSLIVELHHALEPGQTANLTVSLRKTVELQEESSSLPFPEVMPERGQIAETVLAIGIDPGWAALVQPRSPAGLEVAPVGRAGSSAGMGLSALLPAAASLWSRALWGDHAPDYLYRSHQAIQGQLVLRPRQPSQQAPRPHSASARASNSGSRKQPASLARIDREELKILVPTDGRLACRCQFAIESWKQPTLPIVLPAGSQLDTVRVDGRWLLNLPAGRETARGVAIDVPAPAGDGRHAWELTYSQEAASWRFWGEVNASAPILPVQPAELRRRWELAGELAFVNEAGSVAPSEPGVHEGELLLENASALSADRVLVVRSDRLWGLAWSLTALLLLSAWRLKGASWLLRYSLLILWLASSSLLFLWLPASLREVTWPLLLSGLGVAACWYVLAAVRSRAAAPRSLVAAGLFLGLWGAGIDTPGAGPAAETVWLLPASTDGKQEVLVRPQLLKRLDEMAKRARADRFGSVLLQARYDGWAAGDRAEVQAEFQAHCFSEAPVNLVLPLAGIDLQRVSVDGHTVQPQAWPDPTRGYLVPIQGMGDHTIVAQFSVAVPSGDEHELHFGIPPLPQTHLTWTVPGPVQYLFAVSTRGAQANHVQSGGSRLEADLGRMPVCQVRWRPQGKPAATAQLDVKELYFWELRPTLSRLLAILQYRIKQGSTDSLAITLPGNLEVRHVEVDPWLGTTPPPRLRDWSVSEEGGERKLKLRFQLPLNDGVQVFLELLPLEPEPAILTLPLPRPAEAPAAPADSLLAYRVEGAHAELADFAGVSAVESQVFENEWRATEREIPGTAAHAFRFRRAAGGTPMLRLRILRSDEPPQCSQSLVWRVNADAAELEAQLKLTASQAQLAFLEWQVPPDLHITQVRSPLVHSWSRTGSHLQIWLSKSITEARLELAGWESLTPKSREGFQLPVLAPRGILAPRSSIRVAVPSGFIVKPVRLQKLRPINPTQPPGNDHTFVAEEADYQGEFVIQPASQQAPGRGAVPRLESQAAAKAVPSPKDVAKGSPSAPSARPEREPISEPAPPGQALNQAAQPWVEPSLLAADQKHRAAAGTAALLVLIVAACLVPVFPRLVRFIQVLWPEQIAALGCAGWFWLGGSSLCLIPVALGLAARLAYLAAYTTGRRRASAAHLPAGTATLSRG